MASPEEMADSMRANLLEKTGRDHAAWMEILKQADAARHGEMVSHLKSEHGVSHGYANLLAHDFRSAAATDGSVDLMAAQYSGAKADLAPIRDALLTVIQGLGGDVEVVPKKSYVSLRRTRQFALIQPSSRTRVDVGINLPESEPTERLEASGSFSAMVSHRVRVTAVEEVDDELTEWLRQAYEAS